MSKTQSSNELAKPLLALIVYIINQVQNKRKKIGIHHFFKLSTWRIYLNSRLNDTILMQLWPTKNICNERGEIQRGRREYRRMQYKEVKWLFCKTIQLHCVLKRKSVYLSSLSCFTSFPSVSLSPSPPPSVCMFSLSLPPISLPIPVPLSLTFSLAHSLENSLNLLEFLNVTFNFFLKKSCWNRTVLSAQ